MNNNKKKKYGTGLLVAVLVVGVSMGLFAGFVIGSYSSSGSGHAEETENSTVTDSVLATENEPSGGFAFDEDPVLTINDTTIYLDEINARVYMARDQYVSQYGEEPWNTEIEDGVTVAEYAKNTMLDEMERVTILCGKAADYGVEALTEEEEAQCTARADDYIASLGSEVAVQFSVDREAMLRIYEKDALSMKVYNKILENLTDTLRADAAYKDMEDSEFEAVLMKQFDVQYEAWKNECEIRTTETWDHLVIGAMG